MSRLPATKRRQTGLARVLVDEVACGITLGLVVLRDPQVLGRERGTGGNRTRRVGQEHRLTFGVQRVPDILPQPVLLGGIGYVPDPGLEVVGGPLPLGFGGQLGFLAAEGIAPRVLRPIGTGTASTSSTVFTLPSTAMSSRAEKRCWWNGAPRPGAICVENPSAPR